MALWGFEDEVLASVLEPRSASGRMIPAGGTMVIGDRLKALREGKNLSQEDIEKRTGLLRVYISRVENGHTVPAIVTILLQNPAVQAVAMAWSLVSRH